MEITKEQVKDIYAKFITYYKSYKDVFFTKKQKHLVEDIKKEVYKENMFIWNDTSLNDYLNALVYMLKGQKFTRTINKFSEEYFLENICKNFGEEFCNKAKYSLTEHKKYYKDRQKNKFENLDSKKPEIDKVKKNNIKNIILYGAPGVGKTHNYQRLISMIENGDADKDIFDTITNNKSNEKVELNDEKYQNIKNEKRVKFITFHQSYSYEDFIEGFRPNKTGNIELEDGVFKSLCKDAVNSSQNYYLVIDEINRGNISKIFGELITLIEEDKRDKYEVTLPYSKEPFKVPSNLYIIATMNSTDKSIATIDIALRRRFTFLKMKPNENLVEDINAKDLMQKLNTFIKNNLGEDYMLGHSYFMGNNIDLEFIIEYKLKPLLEEYFYADDEKLKEILKLIESYND